MTLDAGALPSLPRRTLREEALSRIREAILAGTLPPGTPLGEVAVSEQLGVSRGTVREAFRTLQQEDLVEAYGRGLRVRKVPAGEVEELFSIRAALESLAIRHIMTRPDADEVIRQLEAVLPPAETAQLSYRECLDLDLAFHRALVTASQNRLLLRMWTTLENSVRVVVLAEASEAPKPVMTRAHHLPIVEAMRAGDRDRARDALYAHMASSAEFFAAGAGRSE